MIKARYYDAMGNTTGYSGRTLTYSDAGRLTAVSGSASATYAYNGLGQRVRKTTGGVTTYFLYDEAGHLIGEYEGDGDMIQEIVWLGDTPVASLRWSTCGLAAFYIHTDHLNTPRRITKRSTPDVVWRWDSDPFGTTAPNEDSDGDGNAFKFNLRLPGQYYDAETATHYNYFRDYDAQTGRYVQSDPIGLQGGINTYAYVGGNPISRVDPFGLQGFDPGSFPPDPTPGGRDPRTPWQPPGVARDVCPPYFRTSVEISGASYSGLIPLVSEETIDDDGCVTTVLCTYRGYIVAGVNFGGRMMRGQEVSVTQIRTRRR